MSIDYISEMDGFFIESIFSRFFSSISLQQLAQVLQSISEEIFLYKPYTIKSIFSGCISQFLKKIEIGLIGSIDLISQNLKLF